MAREVLRQPNPAVGHGSSPFSTEEGSILSVIWTPTEDLDGIVCEHGSKSV